VHRLTSTIAQSIGLQDARDRPLMEHLVSQLRERQLLIVLGNLIQRRAARRLSHVYVAYPPGPLARPDGARGAPIPGQRVPDIAVRAGSLATTPHRVLRSGRHVLVVPAEGAASVLGDPALRPRG
jgi:hypothetical protein